MNRKFLINLFFLLAINLLIKPFYLFGIDRTVQNTLPPGEYGIYFALFNFTFLFQIINDLGIQNFNNRAIAQNRERLGLYLPNIAALKLLLGFFFALAVLIAGWLAGYLQRYPLLLCLIACNQFLNAFVLYLRSNVSGLGFYKTDSLLSVTDKLLLILILTPILYREAWSAGFQLLDFVMIHTGSLCLTLLLCLGVILYHHGPVKPRLSGRFMRLVLLKSYPFAFVVLLMTLYTRIDGVMIERLLSNGKYEADLYASGFRLLDAANMLGFLFAGLLLPMFARLIKAREPVGDLVRFSIKLILPFSMVVAAHLFAYRRIIMPWLYTDGNAYSGDILGWLMLSYVPICGGYIYGALLTANGYLKPLNLLFLLGVVANIAANLLLIPRRGAEGAALATLFTQSAVFLGQVWLALRIIPLRPAPGLVLKLLLFGLLTAAGSQLLHLYPVFQNWIPNFLVSSILTGLMIFPFRFFDRSAAGKFSPFSPPGK